MHRLPHTTQLLYSQLLESLRMQSSPQTRGLSFVSKQVKGNRYWYAQYTIGSKKQQRYIGPDNVQLHDLIANFESFMEKVAPHAEHTASLVRMLKQNQCYSPLKGEFRVLQMLALPGDQEAFGQRLLESGFDFFEIPKLNNKHPSTSFKSRKEDIKLDLITPLKSSLCYANQVHNGSKTQPGKVVTGNKNTTKNNN